MQQRDNMWVSYLQIAVDLLMHYLQLNSRGCFGSVCLSSFYGECRQMFSINIYLLLFLSVISYSLNSFIFPGIRSFPHLDQSGSYTVPVLHCATRVCPLCFLTDHGAALKAIRAPVCVTLLSYKSTITVKQLQKYKSSQSLRCSLFLLF